MEFSRPHTGCCSQGAIKPERPPLASPQRGAGSGHEIGEQLRPFRHDRVPQLHQQSLEPVRFLRPVKRQMGGELLRGPGRPALLVPVERVELGGEDIGLDLLDARFGTRVERAPARRAAAGRAQGAAAPTTRPTAQPMGSYQGSGEGGDDLSQFPLGHWKCADTGGCK